MTCLRIEHISSHYFLVYIWLRTHRIHFSFSKYPVKEGKLFVTFERHSIDGTAVVSTESYVEDGFYILYFVFHCMNNIRNRRKFIMSTNAISETAAKLRASLKTVKKLYSSLSLSNNSLNVGSTNFKVNRIASTFIFSEAQQILPGTRRWN